MHSFLYNIWGLVTSQILYPYAEYKIGRQILPKLRTLRQEAKLPFSKRKTLAQQRLASTLEAAGADVPYYRDLFRTARFDPVKVRNDVRYLNELPYLTKEILREQGTRLVNEKYANLVIREQKTGSSTGPAAIVRYDQESLDWTAAQNILMLEWGGKYRCNREAHLSTMFTSPLPPEAIHNEERKCFVLNRCNIYTGGFDDASQEQLLMDLRAAHARIVQGHPSSIFALARYLKRHGKSGRGLFSIFVSTGEMLTQAQRSLIEEVLGVRVSNRDGACEFGVMAQERTTGPRGELMVSDSLVWPELLPNGEDDIGELVFTSLRNPCMPLIRYRMGDLGALEERQNGWWITQLTGRTHDAAIIDGKSYPTHFIQDILDRCGDITDFQIAVDPKGNVLEFRLVTPPEAWDVVLSAVRQEFPSVPVRRIEVTELVFVGIRGKFSYLVRTMT